MSLFCSGESEWVAGGASVFNGRHAGFFTEQLHEIINVMYTDFMGDLRCSQISGPKQSSGLVDSHCYEVIVRRKPRIFLKLLGKVVFV